jgi:predicted AlkP superfamily pyrophosphatase or phosphodiesterase
MALVSRSRSFAAMIAAPPRASDRAPRRIRRADGRLAQWICAAACAANAVAPSGATQAQSSRDASPAATAPALVVLFTVDQLRPDYLDRFGAQLTGGLGRLARGGALFTDAHHDHATSETAPGHATTLAGRFPSHTGIVRNNAGVLDPQAPLLGGGGQGASPFRFRGSALFDWMRTRDPLARALSVSRKDRGAILPLGRAKQPVFWYANDGRFTTSTYYADTLPSWVQRFNAQRIPQRSAGQTWSLLLPASAYPEPDSISVESQGKDFTFPHVAARDSAEAARTYTEFPWMDELTLRFALAGVDALTLGRTGHTDLLAVSLSTTDAIGHRFGPDSRELHDQVVRLDRAMGAFLDSLFTRVDSSRVLIALTADHGVAPFPELHFTGRDPDRGRTNVVPTISAARSALLALGVTDTLDFESGMVLLDRAAVARVGPKASAIVTRLLADLAKLPGVWRVDRAERLPAMAARGDKYARRWLHSMPADLPVIATVTLQPNGYWAQTRYATHGSPHDYDTRVPLLFWGTPFAAGRFGGYTRTVDLAPTLAAVLGIPSTEPLDGVVLRRAIR